MHIGGRLWQSLLTLALLAPVILLLARPEAVSAQGCTGTTTVSLVPQGSGVSGTVTLGPSTNGTFTVNATINGLLPGQVPTLTIPTTTGSVTTKGTGAALGIPVTISTTLTGIPATTGTLTVTANNPVGGAVQPVATGTLTCSGGTGADACVAAGTVTLTAQNGTTVNGTVTLGAPTGNTFTVTATLNGLTAGQVPTLIVPTTVGPVTTAGTAAVAGTPVTISTTLNGIPVANGLTLVTVSTPGPGQLASQG